MDVLTGGNVTFTSIVKGTPPFSVSWFKGSSELVPGARCSVSLQDSVAELELFDVDTSQSGEYTCIVSNEAGKTSCTAHLLVKGLFALLLTNSAARSSRKCRACVSLCLILFHQFVPGSPGHICEETQ